MVSGLNQYINLPVIMLEQVAEKPGYPFVGYKFTTPYNPEAGQAAETGANVPSADPAFTEDYEYTRTDQPTMTISITAYSKDSDQAHELALQARSWCAFHGYEYLKKHNIIVAQLGALQNRDTLIVGDYERRQGFDAVLRVTSQVKRTVPLVDIVGCGYRVKGQ